MTVFKSPCTNFSHVKPKIVLARSNEYTHKYVDKCLAHKIFFQNHIGFMYFRLVFFEIQHDLYTKMP